jgi:hypothetical protein
VTPSRVAAGTSPQTATFVDIGQAVAGWNYHGSVATGVTTRSPNTYTRAGDLAVATDAAGHTWTSVPMTQPSNHRKESTSRSNVNALFSARPSVLVLGASA